MDSNVINMKEWKRRRKFHRLEAFLLSPITLTAISLVCIFSVGLIGYLSEIPKARTEGFTQSKAALMDYQPVIPKNQPHNGENLVNPKPKALAKLNIPIY